MALDVESLRKAIDSLDGVIKRSLDQQLMSTLDEITRMAIKSGVIQHFEFTYELCWKFIQRWIRENKTPEDADNPRTRKELFRLAARYGLVSSPMPWFKYGQARNLASHTYNEKIAKEVYNVALEFIGDAKGFFIELEKRND